MCPATPSRRNVLIAAGAAAASAAVASAPAGAVPPSRTRPNILWLVSEDNNPSIGAYGDPLARTPTIDALARDGVLYRNAFSTAPVCAPSRFSIITGMCAEAAGPAHHMRAEGELPPYVRGFPEHLREAGYYCTNNDKTDYNTVIDLAATWDASGRTAHWRNRPAGTPFFAVFNYQTTHESQLFAAPDGVTDPADVRVPPYLPDTPNVRADRAHHYDLMAAMDGRLAARLAELEADGLADDTIVFYYGDNGGVLPWSKRHAVDDGLRVPLVVRFPRRWAHLAPAPPGSVVDDPVTLMDLGPTVLSLARVDGPGDGPGQVRAGPPPAGPPPPRRGGAGGAAPGPAHGQVLAGRQRGEPRRYAFGMRGRMDERYDMVRTVTDGRLRYIRTYAPHRPYGQVNAYAWQLKSYQDWEQAHLDGTLDDVQDRFWRERPAEELYDTHADPDQLRNLVGDPRHRARLEELRRVLDDHMVQVNDNGFIPEGSPLEGYDDARDADAYPLRRIMALAARAIAREPAHATLFVRELGDTNDVVRYWAANGLLMLGAGAAGQLAAVEERWDAEPSPHVKVVLSELLTTLGSRLPTVAWLAETLDAHADSRVRLQAANALTYVGDAALPALPAIDRAAAGSDRYLRNCGRYLGLVLRGEYTPQTPLFV